MQMLQLRMIHNYVFASLDITKKMANAKVDYNFKNVQNVFFTASYAATTIHAKSVGLAKTVRLSLNASNANQVILREHQALA